eukprot:scaffold39667_cov112-Isochrysis_galbana.AAC.5
MAVQVSLEKRPIRSFKSDKHAGIGVQQFTPSQALAMQSAVARFQQKALLRIHHCCFGRRQREAGTRPRASAQLTKTAVVLYRLLHPPGQRAAPSRCAFTWQGVPSGAPTKGATRTCSSASLRNRSAWAARARAVGKSNTSVGEMAIPRRMRRREASSVAASESMPASPRGVVPTIECLPVNSRTVTNITASSLAIRPAGAVCVNSCMSV